MPENKTIHDYCPIRESVQFNAALWRLLLGIDDPPRAAVDAKPLHPVQREAGLWYLQHTSMLQRRAEEPSEYPEI